MRYNQRKVQGLEAFASRGDLRPEEWAVACRFYPLRASFSYLVRLYRWGYLLRHRDFRGRILYRLSPRGALWLLKNRNRW